ncbi:MAG: fasciclin domain-containing protein, partial [Algoriphagus sp.]
MKNFQLNTRRLFTLALAAATLASFSSCDDDDDPMPQADDVVDVLEKDGEFSVLLTAVGTADLDEALMGPGPFTVFAPTDAA